MTIFASWLAGVIFGLGLIVSGMADPAKVLGFLDLAGAWDPVPFRWLRSRSPWRASARSPFLAPR